MKTKINRYRPLILSRHPSHSVLRARFKNMPLLPFKSVIRLGSTTELEGNSERIEINSTQSIKISSNKLLMKQKFIEADVKTANWWKLRNNEAYPFGNNLEGEELFIEYQNLPFPLVAKSHYGSKGRGNTLLKSQEELESWIIGKNLSNYIFEKFVNYSLEYRLHVTKNGCFYACRKALKADTPQELRWRRHDDTCVWLLETNPDFKKPNTWNEIVDNCVEALICIGADILSFDVKVQNTTNSDGEIRPYQDFILLECNSASSMDNGTGELSICAQKYITELTKLIIQKAYDN